MLSANTISKNKFTQVDDDGSMFKLLQEITDHWSGPMAVQRDNAYTVNWYRVKRGENQQPGAGNYYVSGETVVLLN